MMESLAQILACNDKRTAILEAPDGGRALVLSDGGRILGLFAPGCPDNFFWTHEALATAESAARFFASDEWQNSGGDRAWVAPEVDVFFPEFPNDRYWQPRELDPGCWKLVKDGDLTLVNRLALVLSRSGCEVQLEITRSLDSAPNPLRHEIGIKDLAGLAYAGYTLHSGLKVLGGSTPDVPAVGLWNLVQLPHRGEFFAPTYSRSEPTVCFGEVAPEDLEVKDQMIRYRMRAQGAQKISVRAAAATGRVGYVYGDGKERTLVIRNIFVEPSGEYVDVPWRDTQDLGYAIQACNVHNHLGSFSEVEYHVPAIGGASGRTCCADRSQIWAFRGPAEQIREVAQRLLGAEVA